MGSCKLTIISLGALVTHLFGGIAIVGAFTPVQTARHQQIPSTLERGVDNTSLLLPSSHRILSRGQRGHALNFMRSDLMFTDDFSVPLLLVAALGVGIAAQTFINQMLQGEQGLGAFLKDGGGFNKSGFRQASDKDTKMDPLPWLKLPELDFVEVAGQEKIMSETELMMKLERLRDGMQSAVNRGKVQEAESLRNELEQIMETYGVEFNSD